MNIVFTTFEKQSDCVLKKALHSVNIFKSHSEESLVGVRMARVESYVGLKRGAGVFNREATRLTFAIFPGNMYFSDFNSIIVLLFGVLLL